MPDAAAASMRASRTSWCCGLYLGRRGLLLRFGVKQRLIGYDRVAKKATDFSQRIRIFISKYN